MRKTVRGWAHLWVGASVLAMSLLALGGLIGETARDEKIEQLQVVVTAAGESGLRMTETIDQDFGTAADRHGPQLVIPNDFGVVTDVEAESDTAPDAVSVDPAPYRSLVDQDGNDIPATRIRVGDADVEVSGQHRYVISYTLPAARFAQPDFSHDVVGAFSPFPIEDVTVVYDGIELADPTCSAGAGGSDGGCEVSAGVPQTIEVARLGPQEGITVAGEVVRWQGGDAAPAAGPLPERRPDRRAVTALAVALMGTVTAVAVYLWAKRAGANEVVGASPSEAAFGSATGLGVRKVSDDELAEMATVEFAPPKGIEPWQGQVVLDEELGQGAVTAWFSGAIAADVLTIEEHDGDPRLGRGPREVEADPTTRKIVDRMFANRDVVDLDGYDPAFAAAWDLVEEEQARWIAASGWWWSRPPRPGRGKPGGCLTFLTLALLLLPILFLSGFLLGLFGSLGGWVTALVGGIGVPFVVARVAYAPLLPGRTANGSAYALQTASFRRFLVESEGQHVEWAWQQGLLRQYSAWAVALDAADAWREAMERAGVPPAEVEASSPLLVHRMQSSFASSHVPPSQSSSGGSSSSFSSGGSSGSVGGGGGGGGHGSW